MSASSCVSIIASRSSPAARQNRGRLPTRLVVHKRSRSWDDELKGFQSGAEQVPLSDFVALGQRGIRFFRRGDFPPLRGTYVKFSDHDFILYTTGFVPFLSTYPGARIPEPTEGGLYQESWGLTDVGPISHADGGDRFWLCDELAPSVAGSVAGSVDDVVVSVEDEV
jgi:hypothetical protein